ncbi:MAG: hypothetical protein M1459_01690 [Patescibacteria group bacterium]|nr:hypothetical protein [Patescibacteria group bacterium]
MPQNNITSTTDNSVQDFDEMKKVIDDSVKLPLSAEEKGEALISLAETYTRTMNNISSAYLKSLNSVIESLKEVKKAQARVSDKVEEGKVRDRLNN